MTSLAVPALGSASLALLALLVLPWTRRALLVRPLMARLRRVLPRISATERAALEAGDVWWEAELFRGAPDWRVLDSLEEPPLPAADRALLEGPVEELCARVDPHESARRGELPEEAWDVIRQERLMGLRIPTEYGGRHTSVRGLSDAVVRLSSHGMGAAIPVMIPASVGPGELLEKYGTEAQRERWLAPLARGEEVPCFALTEPEAGSDAANTRSVGVVCKGSFGGREVLGLRLTWEKRYITLAPVATLIGLAFRALDPEGLLGGGVDRGITCALVPRDLPGVEIGDRHDPLGIPFSNGPTSGREVFVPLDHVIGEEAGVGNGWRMLMECLAAGRAVSLPSVAAAAAQRTQRVVGAYATIREQFGRPIGAFEGVREALGRIGGKTYLIESGRRVTCAAIDSGREPAVVSAIMKAWTTELMRQVVADGMDVLGGAGICLGPRNLLGQAHIGAPIGITVEGANILTRTLIVYGQGALRCHRWARREVQALEDGDAGELERSVAGHARDILRNAARAKLRGALPARWFRCPRPGSLGPEAREVERLSAAFASVSDASMLLLGGALKFRQHLTGRLADALAWLYLATASMRRFEWDGSRPEDLPFARWATHHALHEAEAALLAALREHPARVAGRALRLALFPWGARRPPPSDALSDAVAEALLHGNPARTRLAPDVHVPDADRPGLGRLERNLEAIVAAAPAAARLRRALRRGSLDPEPAADRLLRAVEAGVLTPDEVRLLETADAARADAIAVDAFPAGG